MKHIELSSLVSALQTALSHIKPIEEVEYVSLFDANKRVLAEDIVCTKPLPAFDNSAMDGYAVRLSDSGKEIPIFKTIYAGDDASDVEISNGMCHKIMTGAMIPKECEAIVPFEKAEKKGEERVILPKSIKKSAHFRYKGEEINAGDLFIEKGTLLGAGEIAIIASQGLSAVKVFKQLNVAVLSSGDEIKEPWQSAADYQIYNSNSIGIFTFLKDLGCNPSYIGALPDDKKKLREAVRKLKNYDLIVTSGGVSVGEADFTGEVFEKEGMDKIVHGIEIKPGKHGMFGLLDTTAMIGLPGNPLSSMSMFLTFVAPIASKLSGQTSYYPNFAYAHIKKEFSFKGNRANVIFGKLENGEFEAVDDYKYGSGMLSPLLKSNGYIIAQKGVDSYKKGERVKVIMPQTFNSGKLYDFFS